MTGSRVEGRLDELYRIGGGDGANRPALSEHEDAAHALVEGWMRAAGLETGTDAIGNLYGRLPGREPGLAEVWCGSHLDSVPRGGRFDGALGVVAALEAVSRLDRGARTVTVVAFRDEEGWRFGDGFLGSRAVSGQLDAAELENADRDGVTVRAALAAGGRSFTPGNGWLVPAPAAFVEAHIEQGPVLAGEDAPLGVVTSIVGILELRVVITGAAGHAGTTPMGSRRDAALCAAAFQVEAAAAALRIADAVVTVGSAIAVEPGATNVIARRTTTRVDARAPDAERLAALEHAIREAAEDAARAHGCEAHVDLTMRIEPVACDPALRDVLGRAAAGAPSLPSGAGHDAQVLARAGVPVAMLFVRSLKGGISHSPRESSSAADVAACVDALEAALRELADRR
ncbi:MAG TPA: Zn-dependent hydrolase [Gaiellales bacterium]|nr:Zn-dependent hydrolase [Gaiellales bacterium]